MRIGTSIVIATLLSLHTVYGKNISNKTIYERNCIPCHSALPMSLGEMFKRYLLVYSSERFVKQAIVNYLKHPDREISVLPDLFFTDHAVKSPLSLPEETLHKAVDYYWDTYKVFGKLR